jgi:DNA-binding beta-propeller fold protein YncE
MTHMPTNVRAIPALLLLALAAACGPTTPPPEGAPQPDRRTGQQPRTYYDTARRNTVIENNRPDLAARAGMLVIANQQGASATVLDAATLKPIVTLPVGVGPHEVAVSPDGRWAVVTNYGNREVQGNTLSVIDLAAPTPAVVRTIDLGEYHRPHGAAFVASGTKLLVTSESSQRLLMVDFASGRVDTALATNGRGSHLVTTQRDGRRAWTANVQDGTVTEFDIDRRRTVRTFPGAPMNEAIAATPGGVQVWVGSNTEHTVTIIDAAPATKLAELTGFGHPYRIGISRTGRVAIVNDPVRNTIWIYEVGSNKELARLELGKETGLGPITANPTAGIAATAGPEGVTFDPIADFAYVTLHGTNQVVALDLTTRKFAGFGSVGDGPDGIAYSPVVRRN